MTRINSGVHPSELPDRLLLAEHREIKRVPNQIASGRYNMEGQPEEFTLNKGHVKFFYDKLMYLERRYCRIHQECVRRGFSVQDFSGSFENAAKSEGYSLFNDWRETPEARDKIMQRIREKGFNLLDTAPKT